MSDLLDISPISANWHPGRCAEVRVGDHVTRYVRRGSGVPPIVVVGANAEREPIWVPLVDALTAAHRIVVPEPPRPEVDYAGWLRGFIEGIGLSAVVVMAGGATRTAVVELATADPFTFRGLVLVADAATSDNGDSTDTADIASGGHSQSDTSARAALPRTLRVLPDSPTADVIQRVEQFIAALELAQ